MKKLKASQSVILDEIVKPMVLEDLTIQIATLVLGDESDAGAPQINYIKWPPHLQVDPHSHDRAYCEIILAGSQRVGKTWYHPGHARIVNAGTGYGPLQAGPDGCTFLVISDGKVAIDWLPESRADSAEARIRIGSPIAP
jgi:hypothetical protein